jgi:hypothetical protein
LALIALSNVRQAESGATVAPCEIPVSTELPGFDSPAQSTFVSLADIWSEGDDAVGGSPPAGTESGRSTVAGRSVLAPASIASISLPDLSSALPAKEELVQSALGSKLGKGWAPGGGRGNGAGDGGHGGPQFFDLETAGTKVVYVLDRSESMQARHAEARNRLERVKTELIRSVGELAGEMEFFVIFFNHNTLAMPAEKLQPATLENKRKYLEWCTKMKPGGATDPCDALQRALDLKPDVIYFLTDGDFSEDVAGVLRSQNTRGVPIHTICIGNSAGERQLKEIARQHNGTYKFVQ